MKTHTHTHTNQESKFLSSAMEKPPTCLARHQCQRELEASALHTGPGREPAKGSGSENRERTSQNSAAPAQGAHRTPLGAQRKPEKAVCSLGSANSHLPR